jgi:branched-chain amino acid transport system permease protein
MTNFIQVLINGILISGVYVLLASGLTLVFGVMRIINFAHGEFVMLGAYLAFVMYSIFKLDPIVSLPITIILMYIFGVILQKFLVNKILDTPRLNQILLTFGISVILQNFALIVWGGDYVAITTKYSARAISLGGISFGMTRTIAFVLSIIITAILYWMLQKTELGKQLRAISQEKEAAFLMGINVDKMFLITFGIGAALASIAGVLLSLIMYVYPMIGFSFQSKAFCIIILGGLGSIPGAIIGGFILGLVETFVGNFVANGTGWAEGVAFFVMIMILAIKPKGLFGID